MKRDDNLVKTQFQREYQPLVRTNDHKRVVRSHKENLLHGKSVKWKFNTSGNLHVIPKKTIDIPITSSGNMPPTGCGELWTHSSVQTNVYAMAAPVVSPPIFCRPLCSAVVYSFMACNISSSASSRACVAAARPARSSSSSSLTNVWN